MNNNNEIIIFPQTIDAYTGILSKLNNKVTIFCREKISYDFVKQHFRFPENLYLSKDLAFYLDYPIEDKIPSNNILNCFRQDSERTDIKIPSDNIDISNNNKIIQDHWSMNNPQKLKDIYIRLLKEINKYDIINTNRLHIAIAGTLLNKTVKFYKNKYWKNKAVYQYSLSNFDNIEFLN